MNSHMSNIPTESLLASQLEDNVMQNNVNFGLIQQNQVPIFENSNNILGLEHPLQQAETLNVEEGQITQGMNMDRDTSDTSDEDFRKELELMVADDEEENERDPELKFKTKNEQKAHSTVQAIDETLEERYERHDIRMDQVNSLEPVGKIEFALDESVVIQSLPHTQTVLDLENLLFTQDKILLGRIDDVFGKVNVPRYAIVNDRFLQTRLQNGEIKRGDIVYYDANVSRFISQNQIAALRNRRGCDASNQFDEEALQENEVEFSDDEKEQEFKRSKKPPKNDNKKQSHHEKKKEFKTYVQTQKTAPNVIYNQGTQYVPVQNQNMYQPQQPYQFNQYQQPFNQYQAPPQYMPNHMQGIQNQIQQPALQNMPLFFNPMIGHNQPQHMGAPTQGLQGYNMQHQNQQIFVPNNGFSNNLFQHRPNGSQ